MTAESRHISVWISQPPEKVYEFAADPANLPEWIAKRTSPVVREDDRWFAETADGRAGFTFAPRNDFGVLDLHVEWPSGERVYQPVRVIEGPGGCEVVVTQRRRPGMSDKDFDRETEIAAAMLTRLRVVTEDR